MPKVVTSGWGNDLICGFESEMCRGRNPCGRGAGRGGKCPSVPFQLFSLPAVPLQLFPCPANRGWERRAGIKRGWIGTSDQHKTLKCKNFSNRHCFGHKNCGGEKEIFVVLQRLTGAVRTGRVCSQLSTRFGAERNRNPKQEGNISYPAAAPRFLPPSPAPRSSFCYF